MTVSYTAQVATCRGFGCFLKLLWRWRGSIYKLVWLDLSCFLVLYYILNLSYRFAMSDDQQRVFESIVRYCSAYSNLIPLSFVLGFYVSIVMTRWWNQYTSIPWPDPIAVFVSATVHGQDERGRVMRRTIMRYVCLCLTMVLGNVSPRVKKRFPTLNHYVEAGLLNDNEHEIIDDLNKKFPKHSKHWLPIVWAASIITRARKEGRIRDDFAVKTIIDELNKFRGQCGLLISYDTISIPLVYTQVVTLAVYSYFVTSVVGQQWIKNKTLEDGYLNKIDLYFPIFSLLQFFFYMGWLKVAEQLINPFGEDDDDFEVNWMVDRNLQVSYLIVDEMHHDHPELLKDAYWDSVVNELPYTVAAANIRDEPPVSSTANIEVKKEAAEIIPVVPSAVKIDDMVGKSSHGMEYQFPDNNDNDSDKAENDNEDARSGIHFSAGGVRRRQTSASSNSIQSMSRVASVASMLKRLISREDSRGDRDRGDSRPNSADYGNTVAGSRMSNSASAASIQGRYPVHGSMKIADQVIEEVDEQMTITSMRGQPEPRPTAQSIFSQIPPHSDPVDVPGRVPDYIRLHSEQSHLFPTGGVDALLSSSAPAQSRFGVTSAEEDFGMKQFGSQETDKSEEELDSQLYPTVEDNEFERLKVIRENERIERQKQKLARSISNQQGVIQQMDTQDILMDVIPRLESGGSSPTEFSAKREQVLIKGIVGTILPDEN